MPAQIYKIKGMHCASCAVIIEKTLAKATGVDAVEANYGNESAKISFNEKVISLAQLNLKLKPLGYSFVIPDKADGSQDKLAEISKMKIKMLTAMPLAALSIFIMAWDILAKLEYLPMPGMAVSGLFNRLLPILAAYMLLVIGKPYLLGLARFIRYGQANMDTLIGLGTSVAYLYSFIITVFNEQLRQYLNVEQTYYDVTIVVIAFIALGKYLEALSKLKTGDAITKLLNLQAKTALVIKNGKEIELPLNQVALGDLIIVKPGGKIPVDGVITNGSSFIDEAMITGEPMPVQKNTGDTVIAGTINTTGAFTFKATKIGAQTMLAQIIKMVGEAQGSKAPIQALADKISGIFVPIVLILAFITLGLWLLIGAPAMGFSQALSYGLSCFVGILVIACPCALGLATPTAIIVGVGKGAGLGILIKDAATLEKLGKVDTMVVDKTGTITKGKPELVSIKNYSKKTDNELLELLASLENKSEHPIATAIIAYAKLNRIEFSEIKNFEIIKGRGLKGTINNTEYFAGNAKLISSLGLKFKTEDLIKETLQGKTPIVIADKNGVLGVIMVADIIKPEAITAIKNLHQLNIKVIMLTGDDKNTALSIAKEAGIDTVAAEALPEDKLKKIKELQNAGHLVAMAGDGINDPPALAQADVGIAMGNGTDVAIATAGLTLLGGDIAKLAKAIRLSRLTMRGIKQNLFWAFFYNLLGIPIAAGILYPFFHVLLNPIFAGLAMALSSVSVVSNSLRLKAKKL